MALVLRGQLSMYFACAPSLLRKVPAALGGDQDAETRQLGSSCQISEAYCFSGCGIGRVGRRTS